MYSHLDSIFKTHIRQTETADARLHIRKDDPREKQRHKNQDREEEDEDTLWEDRTTVSTIALKVFLENILPEENHKQPDKPDNREKKQNREQREQISPQRTHAIHAYQHSAKTRANSQEDISQTASHNPRPPLSKTEITAIHKLITDLNTLIAGQVTELTLRPAGSFLQSLIDTVEAYKKVKKP